MKEMRPTREKAFKLLKEYTESEALIMHALQVEAAMIEFGKMFGEDEELYGIVGLLHDIDYDKYPDEHLKLAPKILKENDIDEDIIRAVMSHGYGMCTDVKPESNMEKSIYTVDELTGIINACCLLRPSKSVLDLNVKSVNKKFKDKKFAAGCDRDVILNGCEMLGMDKNDVIEHTIKGLKDRAEIVGLKGEL
ncbi:HD phosphohydrolase family protein [Peptoniphilus indolicus ATCC 29427]|uniref:HD phosphohydrolase family protein n=2 Tax=Peptoniphilus indolicus TaxID=33030 RepID=G4D467_9FIRM|nr:HD phosphohydrolase family protein [Peptoniphilus indolicus ATCC 29427]